MYGWLVNGEDRLDVVFQNWCFQQLTLTPQEIKERGGSAAMFASKLVSVDFKARVFGDLAALNKAIPADFLEHARWMCLAHHRLPDGEREAREKRIASIVDGNLSDVALAAQQLPSFKASVKSLKQCAIVVCDAVLEYALKTHCNNIWADLGQQDSAFIANRSGSMKFMTKKLGDAGPPLTTMLLSCSAAEFKEREPLASKLVADKRTDVVIAACKRGEFMLDQLAANDPARRAVALSDALAEIVRDATQGERPKDWGDIIEAPLRRMADLYAAQNNQIFWASVAAVEAGTSLGDKTASSLNALKAWKQQIAMQSRHMMVQCLRETRKSPSTGKASGAKAPTQAQHDLSSLSPGQLAQWIEGPLADPKPKPIDRKAILSKEQAALKETSPPKVKNQPEDPPLAANDVTATIQDALSATVGFFLAELQDLLALATQLKIDDAAVIHPCEAMLKPLLELAQKPVNDDMKARQMLGETELHIEALRARLKTAKASAQVRKLFPQALCTALNAEPIVYGKRQGRAIDCKVVPEDWTFVNESFHRRWLPQFRQIQMEGQSVPLGLNEALALHVTGGSRSGYAFNISVHLWYRRAGSKALPSLENGVLYPRMDEAHWFDSYTTCCVLHVPRAG